MLLSRINRTIESSLIPTAAFVIVLSFLVVFWPESSRAEPPDDNCAKGYEEIDIISPDVTRDSGPTCVPKKVAQVRKDLQANRPNSCASTIWSPTEFVTCLWYSLVGYLGSIPLSFGIIALSWAGSLFNWLVDHTIVQFATSIYEPLKTGIEIAWKAFRDLANILIIGMFTFIAISMILGTETFGTKKMVARVLVIAVLINFSLLFTKIIIDASNFTAKVFYDAANIQTSPPSGTVSGIGTTDVGTEPGIAGRYIRAMGIPSVAKTSDLVSELAKKQGSILGIIYGVLVGTILFAAAIVFLYGSFLIAARTVLMVVLLISSSLAFASYLIPRFSEGHFGWKVWWSALLKNAVFGPLLMIGIWATLTVAEAYAKTLGGGALTGLVTKPTEVTHISALFGYLFILGLLYVSIRLASSFSSEIPGINIGKAAIATPLAAASRIGGAMGRFGIGMPAHLAYRGMRRAGWGDPDDPEANSNILTRGAMRVARGLGTSTFDMMNRKDLRGMAAKSGALTFGQEVGKGGYFGGQQRAAKKAADDAASLAPTQADLEARRAKMIREERTNKEELVAAIKAKRDPALEKVKAGQSERPDVEKAVKAEVRSAVEAVGRDKDARRKGGSTPTAEETLGANIENQRSILRKEGDRTERAAGTAREHGKEQELNEILARINPQNLEALDRLEKLDKEALEHPDVAPLQKEFEKLTKELSDLHDDEKVKARITAAGAERGKKVEALAQVIAKHSAANAFGLFGKSAVLREETTKQVREAPQNEFIKKLMAGLDKGKPEATQQIQKIAAQSIAPPNPPKSNSK